ncbi:hypothetical protein OH77DRAFT_1106427 [Trametes cingulata]|nr:hypothetical protein OH77DRAFT_1106427 [Trametes cingulata]
MYFIWALLNLLWFHRCEVPQRFATLTRARRMQCASHCGWRPLDAAREAEGIHVPHPNRWRQGCDWVQTVAYRPCSVWLLPPCSCFRSGQLVLLQTRRCRCPLCRLVMGLASSTASVPPRG